MIGSKDPASAERRTGLTARQAFELIADIEERADLLSFEVEGWCVWPLLRKPVADSLTNLASSAVGLAPSKFARLAQATTDLWRLASVGRAELLLKTYTSGLLDLEAGRYKDIWFDDLYRAQTRCVKLESVNTRAFEIRRRNALVPSSATTTLIEFLGASIGSRLNSSQAVRDASVGLGELLRNDFALTAFSRNLIEGVLKNFCWQKRAYRVLLGKVRPAAVVVADPSEHALVAAAKELRIPVSELQHGVNDRYHAGYSWTAYAIPYRSRMPVPDQVLVYGEHWRRELAASGFWGKDVVVAGSPRMDDHRSRHESPDRERGYLLVTTQGIEPGRIMDFLSVFLADTAQSDQQVVIKLHPIFESDPSSYISRLGDSSRVRIVRGSQDPSMFELLRAAAVHVSVSSASHYDALGLGVPTVVLPLLGHDVVMPLVEAGHALLARNPAELATVVAQASVSKVSRTVREYYFASDAVNNIQRALGFGRRYPN